MNSRLILTLIPLAGLFLAGCNKSEPEAAAPPAKTAKAPPVAELPPPPVTPPLPAGPSESEKHLTEKMRTMELRQAELEQQLEEEKLARLEAEIAKERDLMEKERQAWALEQQLAAAKETPPPSVSKKPALQAPAYNPDSAYDYQTFYDDLTPYGSWYNSPDYGYVWQPSVYLSDNSWRPYTRGCWNSCDAGWMWASDEPFGWACYHYGRWAQCRGRGWIWIPGDQWAPAWVCWRKNDDYVGWCPLPPETVYHRDYTWGPTVDADCGIHPGCYVFVPAKHFDKPVLGYCEAPSTCLRICGSTVNITNLICRHDHVQCDGPRRDWITQCVHRPVPQYELAFESGRDAHGHPSHRVENNRLHIFAPKMETPWNSALRPRAQVAVMEKTEIIRSTSGVPDKLLQRYKTGRIESEKAMTSTSSQTARHIVERQQKLAEMEKSRETVAVEAQRQAENVKGKLAAGPQRPEVPTGKPPRALPVEPQQTGRDVPPPAGSKARPSRSDVGVGGLVREDNQVTDPASPWNAKTEAAKKAAETVAASEAAAANSKGSRIKAMEDQRRQLEEARAAQAAKDQQMSEQAAAEQKRATESAGASEAAAANSKGSRIKAREDQRRQLEEARAAKDQQMSEQAAAEQKKAAEAAAETTAANSKMSRLRALQEQRRQAEQARAEQAAAEAQKKSEAENAARAAAANVQANEQATTQRAALAERQRAAEAQRAALAEQKNQMDAQRAAAAAADQQRQAAAKDRSREQEAAREQSRPDSRRAAMEDARQAEAAARAEQAARQREEIERQRAANEQQRHAEEANRAEASRQAAMQEQRRQAEAAQQQRDAAQAAQREAAQREAAQKEAAQREAAAEQQRRAAEENTRREAEDRSRQERERNSKPRP